MNWLSQPEKQKLFQHNREFVFETLRNEPNRKWELIHWMTPEEGAEYARRTQKPLFIETIVGRLADASSDVCWLGGRLVRVSFVVRPRQHGRLTNKHTDAGECVIGWSGNWNSQHQFRTGCHQRNSRRLSWESYSRSQASEGKSCLLTSEQNLTVLFRFPSPTERLWDKLEVCFRLCWLSCSGQRRRVPAGSLCLGYFPLGRGGFLLPYADLSRALGQCVGKTPEGAWNPCKIQKIRHHGKSYLPRMRSKKPNAKQIVREELLVYQSYSSSTNSSLQETCSRSCVRSRCCARWVWMRSHSKSSNNKESNQKKKKWRYETRWNDDASRIIPPVWDEISFG